MGQSESAFKRNYQETVSELSSVQLREITTHFNEVYAKAGGPKGHLVDREAFSKYFKLPVTVGERLFESFDAHKVRARVRRVACSTTALNSALHVADKYLFGTLVQCGLLETR